MNKRCATLTDKRWRVMSLSLVVSSLLFSIGAAAQDDPEYRMETGGGLGLATYEGDFNGSLLKGMQPRVALLAKYKMNPRMAWAAQLSLGQLKGSSKDVKTWYPGLREHPVDFKTGTADFTVRYEYNFWPFGTGKEYLGAKPLTPFIAMGAGLAFTGKPKLTGGLQGLETADTLSLTPRQNPQGVVAAQMLLGAGVKYKLRHRWNLTAEWVMHFTGTDQLDGVKDPYGIKSSGLFKNTDCYSVLQLSLTYDIWAKCKTCHNDRD